MKAVCNREVTFVQNVSFMNANQTFDWGVKRR